MCWKVCSADTSTAGVRYVRLSYFSTIRALTGRIRRHADVTSAARDSSRQSHDRRRAGNLLRCHVALLILPRRSASPRCSWQLRSSCGYDGQFFARLAFNPSTTERTDYGITLDSPAWRQQRILYPFLSWLLSLGRPHEALVWLVMINVLSLAAASVAVARLAGSRGLPSAWGLFPVLSAGLLGGHPHSCPGDCRCVRHRRIPAPSAVN